MSEKNKVVWSEGLFLRPQHLQQQERYFERYVEGRAGGLLRHGWGFLELEVDRDLLAIGKLSLRTARGVFPDGTPFNMPADDALPLALELPAQTRDRIAYLALPVRRDGAVEISRKEGSGKMTRYALREWEARDATRETSERVPLEVATLQPRIVLQGEAFDDLTHLPVAMVREVRNDRSVLLDEGFMPTALDVGACAPLRQFLGELLGMVKQRADVLSAVVTATGRGGAAEFGEFLRLLTMNRYEPRLLHYSRVQPLHPEELYGLLLELAGELATISSSSRRLAPHPPYRQDNLREPFEPLIQTLRGFLSAEQLSRVVSIPIEQRQPSLYVAKVADTSLFEQATFVLAARADLPADALRRDFASMAKLAPVTLLKRYVEAITPGIALQPISVLPPSIPYHAGYVYFELDRGHESWRELSAAGAFGLFVPEAFPGLALEMWAMRRAG